MDMDMDKKRIVIVGGGAGGLELARNLGSYFSDKNIDIMLDFLCDENQPKI